MKILLIFTLYLISGPVSCSDVIGYPGGSVMIYCKHKENREFNKYFCKETTKECIYTQTPNTWSHKERISILDSPGYITVKYRTLSLQDSGLYQCGESGVWNHTVNLTVKRDPCCLGPKTATGHLRESLTISCSYPEQYERRTKIFYKQSGEHFTRMIDTAMSQKGRFSISDNTGSKVVSVRISDVREEDGGVYYCGVWNDGGSVSYYSLYTEIQLQVTARTSPTEKQTASYAATPSCATAASVPTSTPSDEEHSSFFVIITTVGVCVALLLIVGSTLIYKLRCNKIQESSSIRTRPGTNEITDGDCENDPPENQNKILMGPVYQNVNPNISQPDSIYHTLDPRTRVPDSVYHTISVKTPFQTNQDKCTKV